MAPLNFPKGMKMNSILESINWDGISFLNHTPVASILHTTTAFYLGRHFSQKSQEVSK